MQNFEQDMISLEFEEVQAVLDAIEMQMSASELHGYQAALLTMGIRFDELGWWEQFLTDYPFSGKDTLSDEDKAMFVKLLAQTQRQLEASEFEFDLLLPDDDASMILRVASIAEWCAGYLSGIQTAVTLATPEVRGRVESSEQIREVLVDFSAIRQADKLEISEVEDLLETERNYAEIAEYVRVAVMNINMDIMLQNLEDAEEASKEKKPTLH